MNELYKQLLEAYSEKNLNRITGKLIELYQNRNYSEIRGIANKISGYVSINEEKDAKCFSKLIMLYHPDKVNYFKNAINQNFTENNYNGLKQFSHILLIDDIDTIKVVPLDDDIDYHPEFIWDDILDDGFSFVDFESDENYEDFNPEEIERSFYNALKLREFGTLNVNFPVWYLQDYEEMNLAEYGIDSLEGVEYCKYVLSLDLTGNEISDLTNLWNLKQVEELYLGRNQIGYIDALYNLKKLRILDLSANQVDDISPLFNHENLEYLNLVGNNVPTEQIEVLIQKNVIVAC